MNPVLLAGTTLKLSTRSYSGNFEAALIGLTLP
jgi:hypothetical protein